MNISDGELNNPAFQTDPEVMPSGRVVLIRDIKKAFAGEDFSVHEPRSNSSKYKRTAIEGMRPSDQNHYLNEYFLYKDFKLPHGKGRLDELPWVIDFYSFMNRTYDLIQAWKSSGGGKHNSISPSQTGV